MNSRTRARVLEIPHSQYVYPFRKSRPSGSSPASSEPSPRKFFLKCSRKSRAAASKPSLDDSGAPGKLGVLSSSSCTGTTDYTLVHPIAMSDRMRRDAVGTADTDLVDGALQNLRKLTTLLVVPDLRPEVRRFIIAFLSSSPLLRVVCVFSRRVPARQPQRSAAAAARGLSLSLSPRRLSRRLCAPSTTT